MNDVRAKFNCNSVTLHNTQLQNPEVVAALNSEHPNEHPSYAQLQAKAEEMGVEPYVAFKQPTVKLIPVTGGPGACEEDKAFWSATPSGSIDMTITNPAAAELFELGEDYYVLFSRVAA